MAIIKKFFISLQISSQTVFIMLAACTWFLFYVFSSVVLHEDVNLYSSIAFSVIAGVFSFALLRFLGYFDILRLVPRKSDLLLLFMAMPIGGVAVSVAQEYFFQSATFHTGRIISLTPALTLFVFGVHYYFSGYLLRHGRRRKVVLDVSPSELQTLIHDFKDRGINQYLLFLSRRDLQAHLRAGWSDIDLIIISKKSVTNFEKNPWLVRAHLAGIPIVDYRRVTTNLSGRNRLADTDLWSYVLSARPQTDFMRLYALFKRGFEPVMAGVLAVLFAPLIVVTAIAIKISSPGPVLYKQVRTGYRGKPFMLYKFRSMVCDSEKLGPQWAAKNDSRITPFGKFLRKTRIDELPQLWNVIKGEMSFCGPRPERPEIYARLAEEIPLFSMRTLVRPGITGWAQICAGYAASVEESMLKLEYDLYYIQHMSPRLDIIVLLRTVWVAIAGNGSESSKSTEPIRVREVVGAVAQRAEQPLVSLVPSAAVVELTAADRRKADLKAVANN